MGNEVRTEENFFRRTVTINSFQVAVYLPDYRAVFAFSRFRYPHRQWDSSCDGPSPCEERYGLTLFR
jgi:hypothetical protein